MKKLIPALLITGIISSVFVSCGPSAEEKAAAEQRMKDSIAAIEMAKADSLMAIQQKMMEDSLAMVKAAEDSIAMAKAAAEAPRPKPKAQPKPDVPKVGSKKPGAN
jgi:hypothetical protein